MSTTRSGRVIKVPERLNIGHNYWDDEKGIKNVDTIDGSDSENDEEPTEEDKKFVDESSESDIDIDEVNSDEEKLDESESETEDDEDYVLEDDDEEEPESDEDEEDYVKEVEESREVPEEVEDVDEQKQVESDVDVKESGESDVEEDDLDPTNVRVMITTESNSSHSWEMHSDVLHYVNDKFGLSESGHNGSAGRYFSNAEEVYDLTSCDKMSILLTAFLERKGISIDKTIGTDYGKVTISFHPNDQ